MFLKRISVPVAVALAILVATSCTRDGDGVSLVEPEFAKGGKPATPAAPGTFELVEYFVYRTTNSDGKVQSWVHVVGKGSVPYVNLDAVQDFHFNGIRDDDDTPHFEYYTGPPNPVEVLETRDDGTFHLDIPWDGAREVEFGTGTVLEYFKDFPTSDVDGSGADPFSFEVRFQAADWSWLASWQPQGIILGGEDTGEAELVPDGAVGPDPYWHVFGLGEKISSYATFQGAPAVGEIHLAEVYVDPASLVCTNQQSVERVDKEKVVVWSTVVTGNIRVRTASSGITDPGPRFWMELHFVAADTDPTGGDVGGWEFSRGASGGFDTPETLLEAPMTGRIQADGPRTGIQASFAVDYVFPTWSPGNGGGFVYQPSLNAYSGFKTVGHVATKVGDHGAIAFTTPCGWSASRKPPNHHRPGDRDGRPGGTPHPGPRPGSPPTVHVPLHPPVRTFVINRAFSIR